MHIPRQTWLVLWPFLVTYHSVVALNVTILYFSITDVGRLGFNTRYPAFDAAVKEIQREFPEVFQNISLVSIRRQYSAPLTLTETLVDEHPFCEDALDNISQLFWKYYFENEAMFHENMADHIVLVTASDCSAIELASATASRAPDIPALFILANPSPQLANHQRYPTTLNVFAMPDQNFFFAVHALAEKYQWRELHVICDRTNEHGFKEDQCSKFTDVKLSDMFHGYLQLTFSFLKADKNGTLDFTDVLLKSAEFRTTLILIATKDIRIFMLKAHSMGMTTGEHVFVAYQVQGIPASDTIIWEAHDDDDEAAFEAYQALLIVADGGVVGVENLDGFWKELETSYKELNNWTISKSTSDMASISWGYETLYFFAEAVLRLVGDLPHLDATGFIEMTLNWTISLRTRNFTFLSDGSLNVDIGYLHLNVSTRKIVQSMICSPTSGHITIIDSDWFGSPSLPFDFPVCGKLGEKCFHTSNPEGTIALGVVLVLLTFVTWTGSFYYRRRMRKIQYHHLFIDPEHVVVEKCGPSTDGSSFPKTAQYDQRSVCPTKLAAPASVQKMLDDNEFCETALKISRLSHKNLLGFLGISVMNETAFYVSDHDHKCSLKELLDHSPIFHSHDLRRYLGRDIIEGVVHIHKSEVKFHGDLSIDCCWISPRFSLKIGLTGLFKLQKIFRAGSQEIQEKQEKQAEDVYRIGQIFHLMFFEDQRNEKESWRPVLSMLTDSCLQNEPEHRLSAAQLLILMKQVVKPKTNIVGAVLSQLSDHAADLETTIAARTEELLAETHKVDILLREMLPIPVIEQLRRHETVLPEMFECATIMFSDIPAFGEIVKNCELLEIIQFLNTIHSVFDEAVHHFDAYKVETINDSYVVCSGLPLRNGDRHAKEMCLLGIQLLEDAKRVTITSQNERVSPRIGINSGPVASGVVGSRNPRYCIFGDAMNTASRMESHGEAGRIHCSASTQQLASTPLPPSVYFESRGNVDIKVEPEVCF